MSYDLLLTLRTADRGGPCRQRVHAELAPETGRPMLLFVHGFNVDREHALRQWHSLARFIAPDPMVQRGPFLWPSDLHWMRSIARFTYPAVVDRARECGRLLGDYLDQRRGHPCILIGHSLGALVALAAADWYRGDESVLRGLGLAGAAVAVSEMAWKKGQYGRKLADVEGVGFSPRDPVLKRPFGVGDWLYAPWTPRSEAVGLRGAPADRVWHRQNFEIDHHAHWREPAFGAFTAVLLGDWAQRKPRAAQSPPERNIRTRPSGRDHE
ncbi:alpha/beta fold hydrolase [Nocardia altamirensis]|uniref:alpha/beta fold hydrolase n=1 Tax=Nocardia altamirensis TaxID=472158 RepID=UPI0008405CD0|nr:alpha/beta fold hydrolase [Nocardia altamirensis]